MNSETSEVTKALRVRLDALAAHRERRWSVLLPEEARAIVSMMGKLGVIAEFVELSPQLRDLPRVSGELAAREKAISIGRVMARDVRMLLALERLR